METLKICMISPHPVSGGGVSSYTKNLVQSLEENGADVTLFSNKQESGELKQRDISVYSSWNRGVLYPFQIFRALAANSDVDIVHVQHEFFLYGGMVSAIFFPVLLALVRLLGKPRVVTIHGVIPLSELDDRFKGEKEVKGPLPLLKFGLIFLSKMIVFLSDAVIVHGKSFAETLSNEYKCPRCKIHVIPHGVGKATAVMEQNEAKRRLRLENKVVILFFGYITKYKGIETLVEAFGRLARKHQDWFLIIGAGPHPRLRLNPNYEGYIAGLQQMALKAAPKQTLFTGFIPDKELSLYFSAADITVFPYNTEMSSSGPLALSMSYGKPVVASDIQSIRELIPFEEALFKKNSLEDFVKKLELMLSSHDLRRKTAICVKEVGESKSWSHVGLQTYMLYHEVCNSVLSYSHGS